MSAVDVMGLRLRLGGVVEPLGSPEEIDSAVGDLASNVSTARVRGHGDHELVMFIDDRRDASITVNPTATQLRGNGWPIVGEAVLVDVENRPLPQPLLDRYIVNDPEPAAPEPDRAIEWDDHLDDRERDHYLDIEVDEIAPEIPQPDPEDQLADALAYREANYDELEMDGKLNSVDAYIDILEEEVASGGADWNLSVEEALIVDDDPAIDSHSAVDELEYSADLSDRIGPDVDDGIDLDL